MVLDTPYQAFQVTKQLQDLLMSPQVHIVAVILNKNVPVSFSNEIHCQLKRGTKLIAVDPLSPLHARRRLVYAVVRDRDQIPTNVQTLINECIDSDPEMVEILCRALKEPQLNVRTNAMYNTKHQIIFNGLAPRDIKLLQSMQLFGEPLTTNFVLVLIQQLYKDSDISSFNILKRLKDKGLIKPLPKTIVFPPRGMEGNGQPDLVEIPPCIRKYLIDVFLREETDLP